MFELRNGDRTTELWTTSNPPEKIADIYFNQPNHIIWKGKHYFVETAYSSEDGTNWYIYDLINSVKLEMR